MKVILIHDIIIIYYNVMEGAWMNNIPVMSDGRFRIRGGKIENPTAAVPDKNNECLPMEKGGSHTVLYVQSIPELEDLDAACAMP